MTKVIPFTLTEELFKQHNAIDPRFYTAYTWDRDYVASVAKQDGVVGADGKDPTGLDFKEGLKKLNGKDWEGSYQWIHWKFKEE